MNHQNKQTWRNLGHDLDSLQSKAPASGGAETYNKLDDTNLLGDSLSSEPGDFKRALEQQAAEEGGSDVTDASKPCADCASRASEDVKSSRDSSDSTGGDVTPAKSESDRESPKKTRKSTASNDAKPEEKKKKVKTHRRVSSASGALMAIGEWLPC